MYNKLNEKYRTMIQQGILKPVSVFKRKINAVDSNGGNGPHRGGRGSGYGQGRGKGGRGSYNPQIDLTCLPSGIELQNLTFSDENGMDSVKNRKRQFGNLGISTTTVAIKKKGG